MKIGVRGHDVGIYDNIPLLATKTREIGFEYIQLVLKKTSKNELESLNDSVANYVRDEFAKNNVEIAMLGAYFNPVHSNKEKTKNDIQEFKDYLKYSTHFDCKYVGTETGSYNDDVWTYHPNNHTEEAYDEVVKIIRELIVEAEQTNAFVAIEPALNHVVYNPVTLKKLIDDIDSEHLVITIDLYNLLNLDNYVNYKEILLEFVQLFKHKIKIFHFKDFIIQNEQLNLVGIGEGFLDFSYIVKLIEAEIPESFVIFEGVPKDKLKSSLDYIKSIQENL